MTATTKKNIRNWAENNLNFFPDNFTMDDYDNLSYSTQEDVLKRLLKAYNDYPRRFKTTAETLSVRDIVAIDPTLIKFTVALTRQLKVPISVRLKKEKASLLITWDEVNPTLVQNFKNWIRKNAKKVDPDFTFDAFLELPDSIKFDWLFLLAKKFGYKYPIELKTTDITLGDMVSGVKNLKLPQDIMDAVDNVIPTESLLQTINRSEMDGWSAKNSVPVAQALKQEEIDALRQNRKENKKLIRMKARAKSVMSLEGYQTLFDDPLFDRDILNTILNRLEKRTAFKATWESNDSKDILKLIVNNPLVTTKDLQRIQSIKTTYGSQPEYASQHLNVALSKRDDLPESELMKLVKKAQFDVKLEASKKDLSEANRNILIEYSIKHHAHMPKQLKEIFKNIGEDYKQYKDEIIKGMYKKYTKDKWKSNGLKTLEIIDEYGWLDEIPDEYKESITKIIVKAYNENRVTKERLKNVIHSLSSSGMEYLTKLYEETDDLDFLPEEAQDIFIF